MANFPPAFAIRNAISWNRRAINRATKQGRTRDIERHIANIKELEGRL